MELKRRHVPFNNTNNSKLSVYHSDIIRLSHSGSIDRLQFSYRTRDEQTIMGQFKTLFNYTRTIMKGTRVIHEFRYHDSLIHLTRWRSDSFYGGVIVHDPNTEHQLMLLGIMPMTL